MNKQFEQIKELMLAMGQPVLSKPTVLTEERLNLRLRLTRSELKEFEDASIAGDKVEMLDGLIDRMVVLIGDFHECGMSHLLEPAFDEVHRSNMTKLCDTAEEAALTLLSLESQNPTEQYYYLPVGRHFVVYRKSDHKFQKSIKYEKPNLAPLLNEG